MADSNMIVGTFSSPPIGYVQVYLAHIAKDDYLAVLKHKEFFNSLARKCGAIRISDPAEPFCASLMFEKEMYRNDFITEMLLGTGVCVCREEREVYLDRRHLPPPSFRKVDTVLA